MDLIAIAVPFFLLALLIELFVDRIRGTGYYRANDAINSLSAGTLSTTIGYFTKIVPTVIWAYAFEEFALVDMPLAWFDMSPTGLLLWLVAMLAWDFCYYWSHRCGHEISILWASHAVHHQSEDYNLSTALRQTSTGFLFNWIFYLPLFLVGFPPEVLITVNSLNLIYQFWVHTQHIGKLGVLDRILVTPSNHRVHHAQNEKYIDRNYGGILVLWDRLFGSFQEELDDDPVVFGVRKPLSSWNPFWANVQVYAYLWFDAVRTRRWRDKLGIWFRRTGWRPQDVEARYPKHRSEIRTFRKYDPPLTATLRYYLIGQFLVAVAGILWIGRLYASQGLAVVTIPCLLLWVQLYTLGMISDRRKNAIAFELGRLNLVLPSGVLAIVMTTSILANDARTWFVVVLYALLSSAWLRLASNVTAMQNPH
ncbi:MAG TPA: sterol desaturase family protein [Woeseiaceae bacterium]|nr:sterol desaturase family protein [Woeseiaceae bacterium]